MSATPPTAVSPGAGTARPAERKSAPELLNEEATVKRSLKDLLGDIERSLTVDDKDGEKAKFKEKLKNLQSFQAGESDEATHRKSPSEAKARASAPMPPTPRSPEPALAAQRDGRNASTTPLTPAFPTALDESTIRMSSPLDLPPVGQLSGPETLPRPAAGVPPVDPGRFAINGTLMMHQSAPRVAGDKLGSSTPPKGPTIVEALPVSTTTPDAKLPDNILQLIPSLGFGETQQQGSGHPKSDASKMLGARTEPIVAVPTMQSVLDHTSALGSGRMPSAPGFVVPSRPQHGTRSSGSMELPVAQNASHTAIEPSAPGQSKSGGRVLRFFVVAAVAAAGLLGAGSWYRQPSGLSARAFADETGDHVELVCRACASGTVVRAKEKNVDATVQNGTARIDLPNLRVGQNTVNVVVTRPHRAVEDLVLSVPLAFRVGVTNDATAVGGPQVTAELAPLPGAKMMLDDKELPMSVEGGAHYAVPVGADGEGEAAQPKTVSREIRYSYSAPGRSESGILHAQLTIAPLVVNHGAASLRVTNDLVIEGKTAPKGEVSVSGVTVKADDAGKFTTRVAVPEGADVQNLVVIAQAPGYAPRRVRVSAQHVASLDAAAKEAEATGPLTFAEFESEAKTPTGKLAVIEGRVLAVSESKQGVGSDAEVDVSRGCAQRGQCRSHVRLPPDVTVPVGASMRAYGVLRAYSAGAESAPAVGDIDASFLLVR